MITEKCNIEGNSSSSTYAQFNVILYFNSLCLFLYLLGLVKSSLEANVKYYIFIINLNKIRIQKNYGKTTILHVLHKTCINYK